ETFSRFPEAGLVASDSEVVDARLRPLGYTLWRSHKFTRRRQQLVERGDFRSLIRAPLACHQLAFRASFLPLILPFPNTDPDGWIPLVIGAVAGVRLMAPPLIRYRRHRWQLTAGNLESSARTRIAQTARLPTSLKSMAIGAALEERLSSAEACGMT